jgi:coenzyme F420 hydrogenase subunit beta
MGRKIRNIEDVVRWGLCTGCGACYYACSKSGVALVNVESVGIRPKFDLAACASCTACLSICPGNHLDSELATGHVAMQKDAEYESGPALEVWEGYASDPVLRFRASSGGLLTALALYCIEHDQMQFVLHTGMDDARPWANKTVQSRNRHELLARTGSRYAPASPCEGLRSIEESSRPCVFIGKPCDAAAVAMLRKERPELDRKLGLVLTFFCAGTPSTQGTLDLMESLNMAPDTTASVRYRGEGWPGNFKVVSKNGGGEKSLSYMESWGRLSHYRPLRCQLCPDGLGRIADISCGDAWERFDHGRDIGRSIAVVRTRRGREILHRAMAAKYVELKPVGRAAIHAGQPNQINRNRELFGRMLAMRLLLIPTPRYLGFALFRVWLRLPFFMKARTILGTLRRLVLRGLWRRQPAIVS